MRKTVKVYKFGGASVRDADAVRNMVDIVADERHDELFVIVSAMGKVTNALEQVLDAFYAGRTGTSLSKLQEVVDFHLDMIAQLWGKPYLPDRIEQLFAELEEVLATMNPESRPYEVWYDRVVSYGELLSTTIISEYMRHVGIANRWVDMRECFITTARHKDANIDIERSAPLLRGIVDESRERIFIGQGFIGATEEGVPTTIGREGSDYSAAVAGYILDARSVTIWKDVEGILNGDPKIFDKDELHFIPELTYVDAIELAYSGAQIIHPKTIKPLQNKNIPLHVRCFLDKSKPGSVIKAEIEKPIDVPIFIIKHKQGLLTVRPADLSFVLEERFAQIFALLERYNVKVNLIQSSAVSLSLCIDDSRYIDEILSELRGEDYYASYNSPMELLTVRGYTKAQLDRYGYTPNVYLVQRSRRNLRVVRKLEGK